MVSDERPQGLKHYKMLLSRISGLLMVISLKYVDEVTEPSITLRNYRMVPRLGTAPSQA